MCGGTMDVYAKTNAKENDQGVVLIFFLFYMTCIQYTRNNNKQ